MRDLTFRYTGSPACTTRGFGEKDFEKVAEFLDRGLQITAKINAQVRTIRTARVDSAQGTNSNKLVDFSNSLKAGRFPELEALAKEVKLFSDAFPVP